jgi:hypothetical protein
MLLRNAAGLAGGMRGQVFNIQLEPLSRLAQDFISILEALGS